MALPVATFQGNLTADPELKFTPNGQAVANFRLAMTNRQKTDDGKWEDKDQLFIGVSAWEQLAENVVETLKKGMAVIVVGQLKQRSYENKEGVTVTVTELRAYDVGPSLRYAAADVKKVSRQQAGEQPAKPKVPDAPPF